MSTSHRMTGQVILLFTAMLFLFPAKGMAQLRMMTVKELTQESSSILYGKCLKTESAWNETGDMIFTTVTIAPEYYMKGDLGSFVRITVPGGQVGNIIYQVSEMPAFTKGEEVIAFIWEHPSGKHLITGGYLGKLKIDVDAITGRRTVSGKHLSKDESVNATKAAKVPTLAQTKSERISLDDFTKEIEGYLNQR